MHMKQALLAAHPLIPIQRTLPTQSATWITTKLTSGSSRNRGQRLIHVRSFSGLEDAASQAAQSIVSSLPEQLEQLQVTATHIPVDAVVEAIKGSLHVSELAHSIGSRLPSTLNLSHPDIVHLLGDSHKHQPTVHETVQSIPSVLESNAKSASTAAARAVLSATDAVDNFVHANLTRFLQDSNQQELLQLTSTLAGHNAVDPAVSTTIQQTAAEGTALSGVDHSAISGPAVAVTQTTMPQGATDQLPVATISAVGTAAAAAASHIAIPVSDASDTVAATAAATAAALQHAASLLPTIAGSDAQISIFQAFSSFAGSKLAVLAGPHPGIYNSLMSSLQALSSSLQHASSLNTAAQLQAALNSLLVTLQQLVSIATDEPARTTSPAGGSSIAAMLAAHKELADAQAQLPLPGVTKLSLFLVALLASAIPKGIACAISAVGQSKMQQPRSSRQGKRAAVMGDELPLTFDPDALTAYFSKRPMQVLQRTAEVMSKLSSFVAAILADWKLGQWEKNMAMRAQQAVVILESLGPAYVKIGQTLSTRVDMMPELYIQALAQLQENVAPFSSEDARAVLEQCIGQPLDNVFAHLSTEPVAAASLGQVYKAQLQPHFGGGTVAVKVQRPGMLEAAALDIFVLRRAAQIFSKLPGMGEEWAGVLDEWALRFFEELDYMKEAGNTMAFKQHMASLDGITVATVHPNLTSRKVLVMSWIDGQKLSSVAPQEIRGLCTTLLNCYLIQLLETGLLHADPHPGNLMRSKDGQLIILDFGLMTEVTVDQRVALVEFIAHLTMEDWHGVLADMTALGFLPNGLPKGADVDQIADLMRKILGQIVKGGGIGKGLNVFSLTHELEHIAKAYKVVVPPYFTLVLRAFCTIEGIALKADPNYSIVAECLPYLSHRLLSDNNPRMRAALHHLLYGNRKRLDLSRLQKMIKAFGAFNVAATAPQVPATSEAKQQQHSPPSPVIKPGVFSNNGTGTGSNIAARAFTGAHTHTNHEHSLPDKSTNEGSVQYGSSTSSDATQDMEAGLRIVGSVLSLVLSGRPMDAVAAATLGLTSLATYPGRHAYQHDTPAAYDSRINSGSSMLGSTFAAVLAASQGSGSPIVSPALKEALRVVFSPRGSYVQELLVDELVAGVDMLSREALIEALRLLAGSLGALGGLKGKAGANQVRTPLLPNMSLSDEDRQTLDNIKLLLSLLQTAALNNMGLSTTTPTPAITSTPFNSSSIGSSAAADAVGQHPAKQSGSGTMTVLKVAGELLPMVPELMPGIQATLEMFVQQLLRRIALRLAAELAAPQGAATTAAVKAVG